MPPLVAATRRCGCGNVSFAADGDIADRAAIVTGTDDLTSFRHCFEGDRIAYVDCRRRQVLRPIGADRRSPRPPSVEFCRQFAVAHDVEPAAHIDQCLIEDAVTCGIYEAVGALDGEVIGARAELDHIRIPARLDVKVLNPKVCARDGTRVDIDVGQLRVRADKPDVFRGRFDRQRAGVVGGELIQAVFSDGRRAVGKLDHNIFGIINRLRDVVGKRKSVFGCDAVRRFDRNARVRRGIGREVGGVDRYDAVLDGDPRSRLDARQSEQAAQIEIGSNSERLPRARVGIECSKR